MEGLLPFSFCPWDEHGRALGLALILRVAVTDGSKELTLYGVGGHSSRFTRTVQFTPASKSSVSR